jgi:FeS assembly SUF system protein
MNPLSHIPLAVPTPTTGDAAREQTAGLVRDPAAAAALEPRILETLATVFDPEIPVNIYELGLIYEVIVDARNVVGIRMTLTAPGCPAAQSLPAEVKNKIAQIPEVTDVVVDVVWDPPWDRDRISEAGKLQLGLF